MESILRQLSKYHTPPTAKQINVEEKQPKPPDAIREAVGKIIADPIEVEEALALLQGFTPSPLVGKLFPLSVEIAYFLFYVRGIIISEQNVDDELYRFVDGRTNYLKELLSTMDAIAVRLFLARVLQAACCGSDLRINAKDRLPGSFKKMVAGKLGCQPDVRAAVRLIDEFNATATMESLILGRVAYLALWFMVRDKKDCMQTVQDCLMLPM